MSVVNVLPNGFLIVTLSPREATMLRDQILDPKDFPWQSSESEIIALEVKMQLKQATEHQHLTTTNFLKSAIPVHNDNEEEVDDDD